MAAKKAKFSVYNDSDKVLDRTFDGTKSVPKAKKNTPEPAVAKTFNSKVKGKKKSK